MQDSMFIGLDVHKATISVAIAQGERGGEVRHWGTIPHRSDHVRKLVEKLAAGGARLQFCYEAGPCGYGLHRQIIEMGHDCIVVAPSLIPVNLPAGLPRIEEVIEPDSLICPCGCGVMHKIGDSILTSRAAISKICESAGDLQNFRSAPALRNTNSGRIVSQPSRLI